MDGPQRIIVAIGAFFLVTTWVTTMLRIYVRTVMIKNVGAEDYLAVFALVSLQNLKIGNYSYLLG